MTILRAEDSHSEWNLPAEISVVQFEAPGQLLPEKPFSYDEHLKLEIA